MNKTKNQKGQMLVVVLIVTAILAIMVPALVVWVQREAVWTVGEQKKTVALNLAEAGIQRGAWKLMSSTATWARAAAGGVLTNYNFDRVFTDVSGGEYRIRFSSGPDRRQVTILAEGRSHVPRETRAIRAIYQNQTIPGAMITGGIITWANAFEAHWGPIMAHGNINITDAVAARMYYPRKFSRQVVSSIPSNPRDTNALAPPNTDNVEWWSDHPVPPLPELDFAALRLSAAANVAVYLTRDAAGHTLTHWHYTWRRYPSPPANWMSSATINALNVYGCSQMTAAQYTGPRWWRRYRRHRTTGAIDWVNLSSCNRPGEHSPSGNPAGLRHFQNPARHPLRLDNRVWYWDGDVNFVGGLGAAGVAIHGTVIVRGNLTNWCGDDLPFTGAVPSEAWREYTKISEPGNVRDTSAINQYPADDGLRQNRATFRFGTDTWAGGPAAAATDVGIRGFLYVGGNYRIEGPMDIYGAVWVVGDVSRATGAERTVIFFDENLELPSLNVVLVRRSWDEIMPSPIAW